ncbi:protein SMAX1-LIKE 3-like [Glycine soja]|uniref:Protein SMAX1-LIKE 3 n=1 Tax=Glycine soja TaxID=3848 RepID=A0A445F7E7_GLYSO|nr:protein SMAX1-LIKE 3-like [Glycine soja]RZB44758.1 Protein SMAX1-LIKE 3 [Glycine soja]
MRGGICSIQLQALTPEAATVVKQAVNLATRRGHAQVTPLHVASAMLATSTGLLRKACLQCHSHPLQCKALELCFNVALNRLPASTSSPLLAPQYSTPSLSNALVAAFKRAQAHQRRGSIENQQQHILALKIEVEQLVISILDDPSVSRVMREAGFSSTLVKTRVEQAVSMEVCSQKAQAKENITKPHHQVVLGGRNNVSPSGPFGQVGGSFMKPNLDHVNNDDVTSVLSELAKRRNTVIVGESVTNAEGVVRGVIERFEVGNVPGDLRYVQFVSLPLMCFRNISKEEVEQKLMEVRNLVKSYVGGGVVLYLGDLKWLFEFWANFREQKTNYCSVEHMVMELKKLVCGSGESSRLWLMGISTFKTYMKCKICHPSLETIWELHPFTIPVGSLSLSLNLDSDFQAQERNKVFFKDVAFEDRAGVRNHLTCCRDCTINFEKEAQSITSSISKKACTTSSLPTWLQNCKEERSDIMEDQENARLKDLCKKWNSLCNSIHRHPSINEKQVFFVSSSPSSPTSVSSHERKSNFHHSHLNWPIISESEKSPKECELYTETGDDGYDSNFIMFMPDSDVPKPDLLSNPNSSPNSASSSEAVDGLESTQMFKEPNAENHKILCDALEKKVPQHKEVIPEIASTVLHCRSGMRKRDQNHSMKREDNQETWMFFLGVNSQAKESISRELAKVVFGSYSNFVTIGMSSFSSPEDDDDSTDEKSKRKRPREELKSSYAQRFGEAVNENPHRVFFLEDLDQVDYFSQKGVEQAIQSGSITLPGGESVPLMDAIVIFSCESFFSSPKLRKSPCAENKGKETVEDESSSLSLDLNIAIEDESGGVAFGGDNGILELVDKQINFNIQES